MDSASLPALLLCPLCSDNPSPRPLSWRERGDWGGFIGEGEKTWLLTRELSGECLLGLFDDGPACFDDVIGFF